jgi:hypothetical protein
LHGSRCAQEEQKDFGGQPRRAHCDRCAFENWVVPILDGMPEEHEAGRVTNEIHWTPSKVIQRLD